MSKYFLFAALFINSLGIDVSLQDKIPGMFVKILVVALLSLSVLSSRKERFSKGLKRVLILVSIYFVLNLALGLFFQQHRFTSVFFIAMFSLVIPIFLFQRSFRFDGKGLLTFVSLLPILDYLVSLVFNFIEFYPISRLESDGVARLQCTSVPANFAMTLFFAIFAHACNYERFKERKFLYFLYLLLLFVFIFLTGARMALLCSLLIATLIILRSLKLNKFKSVVLGLVVLFVSINYLVINNSRNFNDSVESGAINTSGRSAAWMFFWNEYEKNRFLGIGHGNSRNYFLGSEIEFFTTPHNEYLRLMLEGGGVVSMLVFVLSFKFLYARFILFKSKRLFSDYALLVMYFVTLIYSITDNTFSTYQFIIPFLLMIKYFDNNKA